MLTHHPEPTDQAIAMSQTMSQQAVVKLLTLAHDRSEQGRSILATELAAMLEDTEISIGAREQALINEIVEGLINNAQVSVRQQLAQRLAPSRTAPRKLLLALAGDRIEVARPVLTQSPVLTDSDLVSLVVTQGIDHARAIALRAEIGEALVDALVVTGDLTVMQNVATNMGAKISPRAMQVMSNAARFAEQLSGALLKRPELSQEAAAQLYWWAGPELRRMAVARFGAAIGQNDQSLEKTIEDLLGRHAADKDQESAMIQVADWLAEREMNSIKTLVQILRLGHFRLFNIMIARLADLPLATADLIVAESGGRSLAVLCRAINVEKPQFVSMFLLSRGARSGEQVVHPRELNSALAAWDRLTQPVARQLLDNWRQDPSYLESRAGNSGGDEQPKD